MNFRNSLALASILIAPLMLTTSCGGSEQPCDWYQAPFYAKVEQHEYIGQSENGDSLFNVWVDFSSGSLSKELQNLGELRNVQFTREKINLNQAHIGNSFTGIINDLKEGNCPSPIVSFDQKLR